MQMAVVDTKAATGQDLQAFIRYLEENHPGEVLRVTEEVDPIFEVTAILWKLEQERQYPCVIFENVKGSDMPVVTNLHASFARLAMSIGLPIDATPRDFVLEYMKREENPIPRVLVDRDQAPCKEIILTGDEVDVTMLPTLKYHELDSGAMDPGYEDFQGRYITLGYDTMKDPDTGVPNVGIYRLQVKSPNKFGIQISETAHGHYIMQKNIKHGRPTEMAVFNGVHPAVELGCLSFTGIDVGGAGHAGLDGAAIALGAIDHDLGARAGDGDFLAADDDLTAFVLDLVHLAGGAGEGAARDQHGDGKHGGENNSAEFHVRNPFVTHPLTGRGAFRENGGEIVER